MLASFFPYPLAPIVKHGHRIRNSAGQDRRRQRMVTLSGNRSFLPGRWTIGAERSRAAVPGHEITMPCVAAQPALVNAIHAPAYGIRTERMRRGALFRRLQVIAGIGDGLPAD